MHIYRKTVANRCDLLSGKILPENRVCVTSCSPELKIFFKNIEFKKKFYKELIKARGNLTDGKRGGDNSGRNSFTVTFQGHKLRVFIFVDDHNKFTSAILEYTSLPPLAFKQLPQEGTLIKLLNDKISEARATKKILACALIKVNNYHDLRLTSLEKDLPEIQRELARRITAVTRILSRQDLLGELAEGQYLLVTPLAEYDDIYTIIDKINKQCQSPLLISNQFSLLELSYGITFCDDSSGFINGQEVIRHCETATYEQTPGVYFYNENTFQKMIEMRRKKELLESGICSNDILQLHYQPLVRIDATGNILEVKGAEGLLRVNDQGTIQNPYPYIEVAERSRNSHLINRIGYKVVELACEDLKEFRAKHPTFNAVSLNVSPLQLRTTAQMESFSDYFLQLLLNYDIFPNEMALEITESYTLEDDFSNEFLDTLRNNGTKIYLDDFGTGFSSLDQIPNLSVDKLKIPHKISKGLLEQDPALRSKYAKLIKVIFVLAREFDKSIVVEGIETKEQLEPLLNLGFDIDQDLIQGFYFSKALPIAEFEKFYERYSDQSLSRLIKKMKQTKIALLAADASSREELKANAFRQGFENIACVNTLEELINANSQDVMYLSKFDIGLTMVALDNQKNQKDKEAGWRKLIETKAIIEIAPESGLGVVNDFVNQTDVLNAFTATDQITAVDLFQLLLSINESRTRNMPFIFISDSEENLHMTEGNVLFLDSSLSALEPALTKNTSFQRLLKKFL
jgi:EAL domain-containing protein (putative c-di-GMP-specific phosphodiesterase class I)